MNENEVKKDYNFENKENILTSRNRDAIIYRKDEEKNLIEIEPNQTNLNCNENFNFRF